MHRKLPGNTSDETCQFHFQRFSKKAVFFVFVFLDAFEVFCRRGGRGRIKNVRKICFRFFTLAYLLYIFNFWVSIGKFLSDKKTYLLLGIFQPTKPQLRLFDHWT
ncbi:hypothetical protein NL108_015664 [Boleophthalmus pectinirostris]|nr:hypothetical protein NL108_015664 [Boleophthalmus pectinirostris]